ncbi:MAG: phosphoribosylanthranilate isomerase [Verrucomicrobiota bacterium]|jgi:phosphoribosylanthranilate isomerase
MFGGDDQRLVRPRVKICGITNPPDAAAAIELGADALGFNFYAGSRRCISVAAGEWIADLPPEIVKIAVIADADWDEAVALAALPGISGLQLHGRETPEFCQRLAERGIQFIKALPVTTAELLRAEPSYSTKTFLLDSAGQGKFGGSGRTFPWEIAGEFIAATPDLRVILAGGLTPDNVAAAVAAARPFGVDVTSGIESSPGRKDHGLVRAFIAAARGC